MKTQIAPPGSNIQAIVKRAQQEKGLRLEDVFVLAWRQASDDLDRMTGEERREYTNQDRKEQRQLVKAITKMEIKVAKHLVPTLEVLDQHMEGLLNGIDHDLIAWPSPTSGRDSRGNLVTREALKEQKQEAVAARLKGLKILTALN